MLTDVKKFDRKKISHRDEVKAYEWGEMVCLTHFKYEVEPSHPDLRGVRNAIPGIEEAFYGTHYPIIILGIVRNNKMEVFDVFFKSKKNRKSSSQELEYLCLKMGLDVAKPIYQGPCSDKNLEQLGQDRLLLRKVKGDINLDWSK